MTCHACGAALSANARFCHKCGAAVAAARTPAWGAGLPWAVAGAALGALVTVIVMRGIGGSPSRSVDQAPFATGAGGGGVRPPDISQMSPQERADRLFNRVMTLAEAGKQDSVQFFMPMALGAYGQLPALDADARYHVGLLHLANGDVAATLAQADTIQRSNPSHLFLFILRAHAYQEQGNKAQERQAYADFLRHEQAELALKRPEYEDHRASLTNFHNEAERQTQNARSPTS
jgi:hypothetical protein